MSKPDNIDAETMIGMLKKAGLDVAREGQTWTGW